jgi:hypothetical protein
VEKAVENFGLSLNYASPRLKDKKSIVSIAVSQNGLAI